MAEKIESRTEPSPRLPVKIIITKEDDDGVENDSMDLGTDIDASFQSAYEDFENDPVRDVSQDEEVLKDIANETNTKPDLGKTVTPKEEEELKKLDRSHSSSSSLEDVIAVSEIQ